MNLLILKGFNNYFNRIIKKYSFLEDYESNSTSFIHLTDINFNPNDGVITELVLGQGEIDAFFDYEKKGSADYLVCYTTDESSDNSDDSSDEPINIIETRWFILESQRTRAGQYRLALKRDVISDNINQILNSTCFIEKGRVKEVDNPLLYNKESMTYNQIKKDELLLKDETESAWIVGYLNNKASADNTYTTSVTLDSNGDAHGTYYHGAGETIMGIVDAYVTAGGGLAHHPEYVTATINSSGNIAWSISWPAFASMSVTLTINYERSIDIEIDANEQAEFDNAIESEDLPWLFDPTETSIKRFDYIEAPAGFVKTVTPGSKWRYYYCRPHLKYDRANDVYKPLSVNDVEAPWYTTDVSVNIVNNYNLQADDYTNNYSTAYRNGVVAGFSFGSSIINQIFGLADLNLTNSNENFNTYNNAIIHHNNKYYRITVGAQSTGSTTVYVDRGTSLYTSLNLTYALTVYQANQEARTTMWSYHDATGEANKAFSVNYYSYALSVEELNPNIKLYVHFPPASARAHLDDGIYDMFCIPYNAVKFYTGGSITSSPYYSLKTALGLSKYFGSQLYDLQLLPYCPARLFISGQNTINEKTGTENTDYFYITKTGGDIVSLGLICTTSSATFDLDYTIEIPAVTDNNVLNAKISNECDLYRLVSPNYSGQFEFSVAKNNGVVSSFNVDYTYRPYNPYIHVNPSFDGLYGSDWNDSRGLICGGDFSLPIISDAWTEYQLSNKNYQNIFDRQIANMDVNNQIAKEQLNFQKITAAITGGISGGVSGGLAGSKAGPYGAAAGAALGAGGGLALGLIGGQLDEGWLHRQQVEAKDYATDMYNYQLGNIQAMPYSLTKSGALTNNNKIFPMVELYSCTEVEKEALAEKIIRDGMAIGVIDIISNYYDATLDLSFIRGSLIKIDELNDDYHLADAIYQELQKGVYLTPGLEN